MSRTNIDIDDKLVKEGLKVTHLKTKKKLVNYALVELIKKERRMRILELEGKVQWEGDLRKMRASRVFEKPQEMTHYSLNVGSKSRTRPTSKNNHQAQSHKGK